MPVIHLAQLIDAVAFNYIIGNNDAHGKNSSLLCRPAGGELDIRLAPLYDVVSTVSLPGIEPGHGHAYWRTVLLRSRFGISRAWRRTPILENRWRQLG